MQDERELSDAIRELEERLLAPHVRADAEQLAPLLADDFLEFGSSGRVWTRAAVLEELPAEHPFSSSVRDFRVRRLAPYLVLATYRLTVDTGDATRHSLRSSIWVRRSEQWQMLFHQGTRCDAGDA